MREHLKRDLMLGVAVAAVIAGVIIALASGVSHHHAARRGLAAGSSAPGDEQLAAEYLGISRAELRRRLRAGESMAEVAASSNGRSEEGLIADLLARRKAALPPGSRTPAAEAEALSRAQAQIVAETNRARGRSGPVQASAAYLGLSEAALRERLGAGQSMAQVAAAQGKSRAGLIEALISVKASRLRTALAEHAIDAAAEKAALRTLHSRVARAVDQHRAGSG